MTDDVDRRPSMQQIVQRLISITYRDSAPEGGGAASVRDSVKSLTHVSADDVGPDSVASGQSG